LGELLNPTANGEKAAGTVEFFNDTGGYGFIDTPDHDDDVFYHMEDVGGPDITEGERVAFEIVHTEKGPRATEVERLS
jgi:CspA family cold shock protein